MLIRYSKAFFTFLKATLKNNKKNVVFILGKIFAKTKTKTKTKTAINPMAAASYFRLILVGLASLAGVINLAGCTQEQQNQLSRGVQNWTGTNGTLEIYAGEQVVKRFMKIDKLTTAIGTSDDKPRPYRYGYGYLDANLNGVIDGGEKRVYFEFSDYGSNYVFFEQP